MRGGFRGGRSYHPGNRPTLSPPPPQKPLAWFPRLKPPREREAGSRLYARLIGESGTRCADWHPHKAAISPPGLYIDVCASSIANRPRVFSLPPPVARSSCLQRQRGEDPGLILEDHRRRWFSASSSRKWEMHSLVERWIINFLTGNLSGCGYGYGYREVIFFWT